PLYTVMNIEKAIVDNTSPGMWMEEEMQIAIEGILIDDHLYPQRIGRNPSNLREENRLENEPLVNKEYEVVARFEHPMDYREQYPSVLVTGTIIHLEIPQSKQISRYSNHLFLNQVKAFQADLLYGDAIDSPSTLIDYAENGIEYKIFIE